MDAETLGALGLGSDVVFQPDVRYLTPAQAATATISPVALTFPKQDNPWTTEVGEGYILWSPQGLTWEETFARRIVGVEDTDQSVTYQTREAALDEIFVSVAYSTGSSGGSDEGDASADNLERPEADWSVEKLGGLAGAIDAFFPDTLAGLPHRQTGILDFHGRTGELEQIDATWADSRGGINAPRLTVEIERADPEMVNSLPGGRWYQTMHRGYQVFEGFPLRFVECRDCYRRRGGSMQRVVFDKYLVSIDGFNVDLALVQAAFNQLDLKYLAAISDAGAARPMSPAGVADEAMSPTGEAGGSARERGAELRNMFPYRVAGLPRAGRVVIRGRDEEPLQARAVWSEDPFDPDSPYLLLTITDRRGEGQYLAMPNAGPGWEYGSFRGYSGSERVGTGDVTHSGEVADNEIVFFVPDVHGFWIHIEADNLEIEQVYRALDQIDFDLLESLAPGNDTDIPD